MQSISKMSLGAAPRNPVSRRKETQRCDKQQNTRRFGNRDGGEKSTCLAVDAVREIEGIGVAAIPSPTPEYQIPEPARSIIGTHINWNRAFKRTRCWIESIDFTGDKAE